MLLKIRERTQSWIAWLIVGLISIPFALFGIESYFSPNTEIVVANVNGTEITFREYQNSFNSYKNRLRIELGENYDPEDFNTSEIKKAILDGLVNRYLVEHYFQDAGFDYQDASVYLSIQNLSEFKMDDKFNAALYRNFLSSRGLTDEEFRGMKKSEIIMQQLRRGLNSSNITPKESLNKTADLLLQNRKASMLQIDDTDLTIDNQVADSEITEYYQKNKEQFANQESVIVDFVELSLDEIAQDIKVTEQELRKLYQENKKDKWTKETRKASHIMLLVNEDQPEQQQLKKINEIHQQLQETANFADIAKHKSEDPGSSEQGGDLGFVSKDTLDSELTDVLFTMKEGDISKPVRSKFGFHILKLHKIKSPVIKPFSELREELQEQEKQRQAEIIFADKIENFSNIAYEQPESLQPLVDELDLKVKTSKWVTREGGDDIFASKRVIDAIFIFEVLKEGQNSDVIKINDGHYLVLRIAEHREKSYKTIEEVSQTITDAILAKRKVLALSQKGDDLVVRLNNGEDKNEIAQQLSLEWDEANEYSLSSDLDNEIREVLFTMPKPNAGQTVYSGVSGEVYTVIALSNIAIDEEPAEDFYERLNQKLDSESRIYTYNKFVEHIKNNADLTVFYEEILQERPNDLY